MTKKYRVVVEVLSLKTLDVEVNASNPEDATESVKAALLDYGTTAESLMLIQEYWEDCGICFRTHSESEEVSVKEATLAPSEHDIEFEPWFLKEMGLV